MPSASPIRVLVSAHRSSSSDQSAFSGQPGHLQSQDDPGLAQPDVGDQVGEALPARRGGGGAAQVLIDHDDLMAGPAQPAARSRRSYWRARLSVLCITWTTVDCRTYI